MTGLYIHIPFCLKKCHYCNFVITLNGREDKHGQFLSRLEKEIAHYTPRFKNTVFDTLYVGGGTPSALTLDETRRLFGMIGRYFQLKENAEVTFEVNPGDVDQDKAGLYREIGVNRISLGAQSFEEATLKRINRCHGSEAIHESFRCLRKAGFRNISLDLMLSLPEENLENVKHSLKETVDLDPEHVSLYELTVEDKTVFGSRLKKGQLRLPNEKLQLKMLQFSRKFLKKNNFEHYELLSYAKPGFKSRHNQIYWANEDYLGLGPGAFSYFDGRRFRNSNTYEEYMKKMEQKCWTVSEEEILNPEKRERESFLLALRLTKGAEKKHFKNFILKSHETVLSLKKKCLIEENNDALYLTPSGQLFAETVFVEFS